MHIYQSLNRGEVEKINLPPSSLNTKGEKMGFSQTTRTTYKPFTIRKKGFYKCTCGKRFSRTESDFFTMNPFNKKSLSENQICCWENVKNRLQEKECPECKTKCIPYRTG